MRGAVTQAKQTHWWIVLGLAAVAFFLVGLLGVLHASQANAAADLSTGLTYTDNGADITVTGCIGGVNNCPNRSQTSLIRLLPSAHVSLERTSRPRDSDHLPSASPNNRL